ncbi:MAG: hypothetical protein FJ406_07610 [Verrucomicrobia bacterium]|nr:hypothetical protein [Verrucomicrobiota bacterium]MBM3871628.1 hypothetical protein [Verrucomicrobiota bacterium]
MAQLLRLQQGQIWQKGQAFLRITRLDRLAVEYKAGGSPEARGGPLQKASKKEFCRLIKGALLVPRVEKPPATNRSG